jgi:tRNA pseudouridine55 synthase
MDGWLIIDKPLGVTSTQVGRILKRQFGLKKMGHVGTLDPLASGVLPVAIGEGTKIIPFVLPQTKTYIFTVQWGESRSTDDAEGAVMATSTVRPTAPAIEGALPHFRGVIHQRPPAFSAVHINGQRAYDLARQGQAVDMPLRIVTIEDLQLCEARADSADFQVTCATGTYVRSLARDIAHHLQTQGYVSHLRRIQDGKFSLTHAISLEKIREITHKSELASCIVPISAVLDDIPAVTVSKRQGEDLALGRALPHGGAPCEVVLVLEDSQPCCIASIADGQLLPRRVFNINNKR